MNTQLKKDLVVLKREEYNPISYIISKKTRTINNSSKLIDNIFYIKSINKQYVQQR